MSAAARAAGYTKMGICSLLVGMATSLVYPIAIPDPIFMVRGSILALSLMFGVVLTNELSRARLDLRQQPAPLVKDVSSLAASFACWAGLVVSGPGHLNWTIQRNLFLHEAALALIWCFGVGYLYGKRFNTTRTRMILGFVLIPIIATLVRLPRYFGPYDLTQPSFYFIAPFLAFLTSLPAIAFALAWLDFARRWDPAWSFDRWNGKSGLPSQ